MKKGVFFLVFLFAFVFVFFLIDVRAETCGLACMNQDPGSGCPSVCTMSGTSICPCSADENMRCYPRDATCSYPQSQWRHPNFGMACKDSYECDPIPSGYECIWNPQKYHRTCENNMKYLCDTSKDCYTPQLQCITNAVSCNAIAYGTSCYQGSCRKFDTSGKFQISFIKDIFYQDEDLEFTTGEPPSGTGQVEFDSISPGNALEISGQDIFYSLEEIEESTELPEDISELQYLERNPEINNQILEITPDQSSEEEISINQEYTEDNSLLPQGILDNPLNDVPRHYGVVAKFKEEPLLIFESKLKQGIFSKMDAIKELESYDESTYAYNEFAGLSVKQKNFLERIFDLIGGKISQVLTGRGIFSVFMATDTDKTSYTLLEESETIPPSSREAPIQLSASKETYSSLLNKEQLTEQEIQQAIQIHTKIVESKHKAVKEILGNSITGEVKNIYNAIFLNIELDDCEHLINLGIIKNCFLNLYYSGRPFSERLLQLDLEIDSNKEQEAINLIKTLEESQKRGNRDEINLLEYKGNQENEVRFDQTPYYLESKSAISRGKPTIDELDKRIPLVNTLDKSLKSGSLSGSNPLGWPQEGGYVILIIDGKIYSLIQSSLNTYVQDLIWVNGFSSVDEFRCDSCTFEDIKTRLQLQWDNGNSGLVGAVLIGDLPSAWYELKDDFNKYGYSAFPFDLYYSDLDGVWFDNAHDGDWNGDALTGIFDDYIPGKIGPEIWISRLQSANLYNLGSETLLLDTYFYKNHLYKTQGTPLPDTSLLYIDDDWSKDWRWYASEVSRVYPDIESISDNETTRVPDYQNSIIKDFENVVVYAHASPELQGFYTNHRSTFDYINSEEIGEMDKNALFYNLFSCSAARFSDSKYTAGEYLFSDNTLNVIGSTKVGSMTRMSNFYGSMASGKNFGESFKSWFGPALNYGNPAEADIFWSFGMIMLGDPTLLPSRLISCGNGVKETSEECDKSDFGGKNCNNFGYMHGNLRCNSFCDISLEDCTDSYCNHNNICETSLGESSKNCCGDHSSPEDACGCSQGMVCGSSQEHCVLDNPESSCGDGLVQIGEDCDGIDKDGQDCSSFGFIGGTLGCTGICTFDTSSCIKIKQACGNGYIEYGEQCDSYIPWYITCESIKGESWDGRLICNNKCKILSSGCTYNPSCGNDECDTAYGENWQNCCEDCGCPSGKWCSKNKGYNCVDCQPIKLNISLVNPDIGSGVNGIIPIKVTARDGCFGIQDDGKQWIELAFYFNNHGNWVKQTDNRFDTYSVIDPLENQITYLVNTLDFPDGTYDGTVIKAVLEKVKITDNGVGGNDVTYTPIPGTDRYILGPLKIKNDFISNLPKDKPRQYKFGEIIDINGSALGLKRFVLEGIGKNSFYYGPQNLQVVVQWAPGEDINDISENEWRSEGVQILPPGEKGYYELQGIALIDSTYLEPGKGYIVRLKAIKPGRNGALINTDWGRVRIDDSIKLTNPDSYQAAYGNMQTIKTGHTLNLKGSVYPNNFKSYEILWRKEGAQEWSNRGITLKNGGRKKVYDNDLGTWETYNLGLEDGKYDIKLVANYGDNKRVEDKSRIYLKFIPSLLINSGSNDLSGYLFCKLYKNNGFSFTFIKNIYADQQARKIEAHKFLKISDALNLGIKDVVETLKVGRYIVKCFIAPTQYGTNSIIAKNSLGYLVPLEDIDFFSVEIRPNQGSWIQSNVVKEIPEIYKNTISGIKGFFKNSRTS